MQKLGSKVIHGKQRDRALSSDDSKFSLHLLLSLESTVCWYSKCAFRLMLVSESMQPGCLRCKAWSLGKRLEIHSIYILILEYSLKQRIKYCDRYRLNTDPSNVALWVEVVAVKLQKLLGSVRWSVQDTFHPHNWKTWTSKQTSGISKIMNRYQNN